MKDPPHGFFHNRHVIDGGESQIEVSEDLPSIGCATGLLQACTGRLMLRASGCPRAFLPRLSARASWAARSALCGHWKIDIIGQKDPNGALPSFGRTCRNGKNVRRQCCSSLHCYAISALRASIAYTLARCQRRHSWHTDYLMFELWSMLTTSRQHRAFGGPLDTTASNAAAHHSDGSTSR